MYVDRQYNEDYVVSQNHLPVKHACSAVDVRRQYDEDYVVS